MVLAVALGALALAACGSDSADPAEAVLAAATTVPPAPTAGQPLRQRRLSLCPLQCLCLQR